MNNEKMSSLDSSGAMVSGNSGQSEELSLRGFYTVICTDRDGNIEWVDTIKNLVTTVGKNNLLDNHLAGSAYTAAWYIGLISSTSYTTGAAAGDTMSSHGGWAEDVNYSQSTRVAPSFAAASSGSKATSAAAVFTMNATTTIKGVFLTSVSTKSGTTGTLFSAGLFSGGDQAVTSSSTLNVTYTVSA